MFFKKSAKKWFSLEPLFSFFKAVLNFDAKIFGFTVNEQNTNAEQRRQEWR
jgi:hypothetical protein